MRALVIKVNLMISLFGLTIDPDHSSFTAVIIVFAYFVASALLFNYASRQGWLDKQSSDTLNS